MNDLQSLVLDRLADLGLSYRRAAAKSGGRVSHATLNNIATGRHRFRLDERTVEGLALALDVDRERVRDAAGDGRAEPVEFVLPPRANRLSPRDRRALIVLMDALLAASEVGAERRRNDPLEATPRRRATDQP